MQTKKARELVPGDRIVWPYHDNPTVTVSSAQPSSGGWLFVYCERFQMPHIAKPDAELEVPEDVV